MVLPFPKWQDQQRVGGFYDSLPFPLRSRPSAALTGIGGLPFLSAREPGSLGQGREAKRDPSPVRRRCPRCWVRLVRCLDTQPTKRPRIAAGAASGDARGEVVFCVRRQYATRPLAFPAKRGRDGDWLLLRLSAREPGSLGVGREATRDPASVRRRCPRRRARLAKCPGFSASQGTPDSRPVARLPGTQGVRWDLDCHRFHIGRPIGLAAPRVFPTIRDPSTCVPGQARP